MANHKSAEKRNRRRQRRTLINHSRLSRIRKHVKCVENAILAGDQEAAGVALRAAQPEMMRGVNKGVMHRNTVSRKLSRLSKQIKALG